MTVLIQVIINGILLGSMYGIAAAGLSLIFGTMRIIFLAQGTMIVFFAFVVYWLFVKVHIDPYLCLLIVVPLAFLVGLGLFYSLFRKAVALEDRNVYVAARGGTDVPGRQRDVEGLVCHPALGERSRIQMP